MIAIDRADTALVVALREELRSPKATVSNLEPGCLLPGVSALVQSTRAGAEARPTAEFRDSILAGGRSIACTRCDAPAASSRAFR
jgi:hypothetical protein